MSIEKDKVFSFFAWSLKFVGITPFNKHDSESKELLFYFLQVFILAWSVTAVISDIVFLSQHTDDMDMITSAALLVPTVLLGAQKLFSYFAYRDEIKEIANELILKDYALNLPLVKYVMSNEIEGQKLLELKKMVQESMDLLVILWKIGFRTYFTGICVTINSFHVLPILLMYLHPELKCLLPFDMAFPWDTTASPMYYITYMIQVQTGFFYIPTYASVDALFGFLVGHIIRQLKIIHFISLHMGEMVSEMDGSGSEQWEKDCTIILGNCAEHYMKLKHISNRLNVINKPFLCLQALCSSLMLCMCTFKIATSEPFSLDTLSYYSFEVTTTVQIAITCGLGQLLINQSEQLEQVILEGWYNHGKRYCTDVKIYYAAVQKPIVMYVWGSIDLSLVTFSAVVRSAMSYFTLVMSFAEEE